MAKNVHWCRYVSNIETKKLIQNLDYKNLDVLEISGKHWQKFNFRSYVNVTYPEFDVTVTNENLYNTYDLIVADQVFEHVRNPFKGVENIFSMLRPNGYFLISTPFFLKLHGCPEDYWRWTPSGLSAMLEDAGFRIVNLGSWGNKDCIIGNLDEWKDFYPGLNLENESDFPVIVWCLGQKP